MSVDTAFQRLREANPAPDPNLLLDDGLDLAVLLEATEQRSTEMQTREPMTAKPRKTPPPRRNLILAMAAIAIAIVVGLVVLLPTDEQEPIADDNQPTVTTAPEILEEPITSRAAALAVAEDYLEAFNAGDDAGVLALLAPDVVISDSIAGVWDRADWEALLAWNAAQGTIHSEPSCTASDDGSVECTTDNRDILVQASNDIGVPTTIHFEVADGLIGSLSFTYGAPDFTRVSQPFSSWLDAQYPGDPDATRAQGLGGEDVEDGRLNGEARARFAAEWANWGMMLMDDLVASSNAQDADAFFASLTEGDSWGPSAPVRESWARLMGADTRFEISNCSTTGVAGETLEVTCDQVVTDAYGGRSGSVVDGTFSIRIQADGLISQITDSWIGPAILNFHEDFITWLAATYPEVHASTTWDHILPAVGDYERMIPYIDEFVAQSTVYPVGG